MQQLLEFDFSLFVSMKSAVKEKLGLSSDDVTVYTTAHPTRRLEAVDVPALSAGTKLIAQILDQLTLHVKLGLDEKVVGGCVCKSLFSCTRALNDFNVNINNWKHHLRSHNFLFET